MKLMNRSDVSGIREIRTSGLDNVLFEDEQLHESDATAGLICCLSLRHNCYAGFEMRTFMFLITRTGFAALLLWLLTMADIHARILNGYGTQLTNSKQCLENLRLMLLGNDSLSSDQRRRVKSKIAGLIDFISLYEITEEAIRQLKMVSPRIFYLSDSLKDKQGRPTDIYIKLVHEERSRIPLAGANFLWQHAYDKDLSVSEFGAQTASIEVWIGSNALLLLSHELGHVIYIVPNLATYVAFYNHAYWQVEDISYVGHKHQDLSGKSADNFMKQFYSDWRTYRRLGGIKLESPSLRLAAIKKQLKNEMVGWENLAIRNKPAAPLDAQ
jgi:hypothetical protein